MTPRLLLLFLLTTGCGTLGMPATPAPNTQLESADWTAASFWSHFTSEVESATVVRVYYTFPFRSGMSPAMLTVHRDGRAAIDMARGGSRDLLTGGVLRTASRSGEWVQRSHGDVEASDWAAAITYGLDNLSSVPVTMSGGGTPSTHGDNFPDLGFSLQYRLDMGDGSSLNLGFHDDGTPMRARLDLADDRKLEYQLRHIVFDPTLPSDFFEPDGTVHANGSELLFSHR